MKRSQRTLWTALISDHHEIKRLLRRLDMTSERSSRTREKLFSDLRRLLVAHSRAEETVLYDRLRKQGDEASDLALEAYEEHHVADLVLEELAALSPENERWGAKISVLKESLEHHIQEEERELIPLARKKFERAEAIELAREFEAIRRAQQVGVGLPVRLAAKAVRKIAER